MARIHNVLVTLGRQCGCSYSGTEASGNEPTPRKYEHVYVFTQARTCPPDRFGSEIPAQAEFSAFHARGGQGGTAFNRT